MLNPCDQRTVRMLVSDHDDTIPVMMFIILGGGLGRESVNGVECLMECGPCACWRWLIASIREELRQAFWPVLLMAISKRRRGNEADEDPLEIDPSKLDFEMPEDAIDDRKAQRVVKQRSYKRDRGIRQMEKELQDDTASMISCSRRSDMPIGAGAYLAGPRESFGCLLPRGKRIAGLAPASSFAGLSGFPTRKAIRHVLRKAFCNTFEDFEAMPEDKTLQEVADWFTDIKGKYDEAEGKERVGLDSAFSEAFALCGQEALNAISKLESRQKGPPGHGQGVKEGSRSTQSGPGSVAMRLPLTRLVTLDFVQSRTGRCSCSLPWLGPFC